MNVIVLIKNEEKTPYFILFTGVLVVCLRILENMILGEMSIIDGFLGNSPAIAYYIIFSSLAKVFNIKDRKENFSNLTLILLGADIVSNFGEAIMRGYMSRDMITYIVEAALIRTGCTMFIYGLHRRREEHVLNLEKEKNFIQFNMFLSHIQSELFYLKKSKEDIENIMKKSYELYQENDINLQGKEKLLDIAREIHEVKKDYIRVIGGFQGFLENFETSDGMNLKDIAQLIEVNTKRLILSTGKNIDFYIENKALGKSSKYYGILTIINNLVYNSIDACKTGDKILVKLIETKGELIIRVSDTGMGIEEEWKDYIYNPGFSTKFDEFGNQSTGVGLSHVKHIVEEMGGTIVLEEILEKKGASFKISIPRQNI